MKSVRILLQYLRPYKWLAVQNMGFNILSAFFALFTFTLIVPFLQILFNRVADAAHPGAFTFSVRYLNDWANWFFSSSIERYGEMRTLLVVVIIFAIASFTKNMLVFLANNCMASLRASTVRDVRKKIYDKILRLPLSYFSEARKGDLMTRVSNDVQEIEISVMSSLSMLFRDPFTVIIFVIYLVITSPQLTIFALLLLPLSGWAIARISRTLKSASFKGQQALGRLLSVVEETLTGLRIIKGFNAEEKMSGQFRTANEKYARIFRRVIRKAYLAHPVSEFLATVVLLIVLYYGGILALKGAGNLSPDRLIAFVVVFSQIIQPAKAISTAWFNIQRGMASIERVNQVIDASETITEKPGAIKIREFRESIEFRNVWFAYEHEPVLRDVSLTIKKGQTVAVVGRSGGGKSTLVDLIPRFMDPDRGAVLIDGIDVRDLNIKDLRSLMGIVSQQAILFNDTFHNNISFAINGEADGPSVVRAATIANAHDFISESPDGYQYMVGEGGNRLSGGQRQRISIARAIMANPPILILDEATSALDTESERLVQDAMLKLMQNRTSVVIAHRLSTVQHADVIVVVEEGRIAECGTHVELIRNPDSIYRKLYEMQSF
ncbi:MAG: ABC transporter ATP-binding protein [Bacteroidales bacterium]|nr:ABC transporter ATP-binding protein [Bacteroidales bacterium]MDT8372590.1 ABC transporter ATP-binding protein [Bacteroidales bacterium]